MEKQMEKEEKRTFVFKRAKMGFGLKQQERNTISPQKATVSAQDDASQKAKADEPDDVVWMKRLLAHDFRMPMAIIKGYADLLREDGYDGSEGSELILDHICSNIDYMNTLLKVLLDDDGGHVLDDKKIFDLLGCLREGMGYVRTIAQKQGVTLLLNSAQNSVNVYGNRIRLLRAFFNMVENSLKYMKREGAIRVTVDQTDKAVYLIYKDDGVGMDALEASHVTENRYQGSNATNGYGIGMSLVKDMVEDFGGTIEIHSTPGQGMGIFMTFPRAI
jgi:signal transduction histidine kinase